MSGLGHHILQRILPVSIWTGWEALSMTNLFTIIPDIRNSPPQPTVDQPDSPITRIPLEITLKILRCLVEDATVETENISDKTWCMLGRALGAKRRGEAFAALYRCPLVCRAWRTPATEVLYSRPILATPPHVKLLKRTLVKTPALAGLVKSIYVPDIGIDFIIIAKVSIPRSWSKRVERQLGEDLSVILSSCHSIEEACLLLPYPTNHPLGLDTFTHLNKSIHSGLRTLTLVGTSFDHTFPRFILPHLEVLDLQGTTLHPNFQFPSCPRLHTLVLTDVVFDRVNKFCVALHRDEAFPSVRSLTIRKSHTLSDWQQNNVEQLHLLSPTASAYTPLEQMELLGNSEMVVFKSLNHFGTFPDVRHLSVGPITSSETKLSTWQMPKSLETLNVYITIVPTIINAIPSVNDPLKDLLSCLENQSVSRSTLRRLHVYAFTFARSDIMLMPQVRFLVDEIEKICVPRGVEFGIFESRGATVDGWIGRVVNPKSMDFALEIV